MLSEKSDCQSTSMEIILSETPRDVLSHYYLSDLATVVRVGIRARGRPRAGLPAPSPSRPSHQAHPYDTSMVPGRIALPHSDVHPSPAHPERRWGRRYGGRTTILILVT